MSVLIKGIEMPKNCKTCWLKTQDYIREYCVAACDRDGLLPDDLEEQETRQRWCPLVDMRDVVPELFKSCLEKIGVIWCDSEFKKCNISDAKYIFVPDENANKIVVEILDFYGIGFPSGKGYFFKEDDSIGFVPVDEYIDFRTKEVSRISHACEKVFALRKKLEK